jgi:ligand-binding SRPBCC domain-containing protein
MTIHTLHRRQEVPAPLEEVWPFFATPENLEEMTPDALRMTIITPKPLVMKDGALFDYVVQTHGVPMRWTTYIADYAPPHRFVDVQLKGPYSLWHHTHTFESLPNGGTAIEDTVRYAMPFGPLGAIAHALLVKRDLESIFAYRHKMIVDKFGAA